MQSPFNLLRHVLSWVNDSKWPQFRWNKPLIYYAPFKATLLLRTGTFWYSFIIETNVNVTIKSERTVNSQCQFIRGDLSYFENHVHDLNFILMVGVDLMQNHWDGYHRKWAKPMNWAKLEFDWVIAWVFFARFKHFQSLYIGKKQLELFSN